MSSGTVHNISPELPVLRKPGWKDIVSRALLIFGFLLSANFAAGQSLGDYRSVNNGSWSVLSSWQRYDGSGWSAPTAGEGYPGFNAIPGRVDINDDITLDLSPVNHIGNLHINSGTLEFSQYSFYVNGTTNITSTLSDNNTAGENIFYGIITIANTGIWNSATDYSDNLRLFEDVINNSNNVNLTRLRIYSDIIISGSGLMNLSEYFELVTDASVTNRTHISIGVGFNANNTVSDWINEGILDYSGAGLLMNLNGTLDASATGNTVNYSGNSDQTIKTPVSEYFNLSTAGSGIKTMQNDLSILGNLNIGTSTTLESANHNLTIAGNWVDNGAFTEGTGTVTFNGSTNQSITRPSNETFYNLILNNTGGSGNNNLTLLINVRSSERLEMISGNIVTGANRMNLLNPAAGSLNHISGTIIGSFRRSVDAPTGSDYLFPIGTASDYRPAVFNFSSLTLATNITAEFIQASPGAFTPYTDGAAQLDYAYTDGYWNFRSSVNTAATYSLSLNGQGFSSYSIDTDTRISGRTAGSPTWQAFGTHGSFNPASTLTRTGLNSINTASFDYCFAGKCKLLIDAGPNVTICNGSSTTLDGTGGGSYSWSPTTGLDNPGIRNPVASPAITTTYTLTVTSGPCTSTDNVTVTVNPRPNPVISGNLTVCPSKTGEIYNVADIAGHSYDWAVTGGTFTGDGTHEITVDWGAGPAGTVSVTETIDATSCFRAANINISLADVTPPSITCPSDISQNIDPGVCNASVVVPNALISDNCSLASLTWSMAGVTVGASPASGINQVGNYSFNIGVTTVTFILRDIYGNE